MARRPLSPHLSVYRFGYTMSLSILHRITGLALTLALLVGTAFLVAAAGGTASYERLSGLLPVAGWKLLLTPALVVFVYHLANGIRHLCWDAGWGLEKAQARGSAKVVVIVTTLVSVLLLWALWRTGGAA